MAGTYNGPAFDAGGNYTGSSEWERITGRSLVSQAIYQANQAERNGTFDPKQHVGWKLVGGKVVRRINPPPVVVAVTGGPGVARSGAPVATGGPADPVVSVPVVAPTVGGETRNMVSVPTTVGPGTPVVGSPAVGGSGVGWSFIPGMFDGPLFGSGPGSPANPVVPVYIDGWQAPYNPKTSMAQEIEDMYGEGDNPFDLAWYPRQAAILDHMTKGSVQRQRVEELGVILHGVAVGYADNVGGFNRHVREAFSDGMSMDEYYAQKGASGGKWQGYAATSNRNGYVTGGGF